jgi:hypothetical protein
MSRARGKHQKVFVFTIWSNTAPHSLPCAAIHLGPWGFHIYCWNPLVRQDWFFVEYLCTPEAPLSYRANIWICLGHVCSMMQWPYLRSICQAFLWAPPLLFLHNQSGLVRTLRNQTSCGWEISPYSKLPKLIRNYFAALTPTPHKCSA